MFQTLFLNLTKLEVLLIKGVKDINEAIQRMLTEKGMYWTGDSLMVITGNSQGNQQGTVIHNGDFPWDRYSVDPGNIDKAAEELLPFPEGSDTDMGSEIEIIKEPEKDKYYERDLRSSYNIKTKR